MNSNVVGCHKIEVFYGRLDMVETYLITKLFEPHTNKHINTIKLKKDKNGNKNAYMILLLYFDFTFDNSWRKQEARNTAGSLTPDTGCCTQKPS